VCVSTPLLWRMCHLPGPDNFSLANPTLLSNKSQENHEISHLPRLDAAGKRPALCLWAATTSPALLLHQRRKGLWSGLVPRPHRTRRRFQHFPRRRARPLGGTGARGRCGHCDGVPGSRRPLGSGRVAGEAGAARLPIADCARPEPVPRGAMHATA
jgi:hypothetical protein